MAHVAKFKRNALGHILRHYERGLGEDGKPIRYNNQNIDTSKSHLNRCLSLERDMSQLDYVNMLIEKCCKRKRKDMVCLVSVVVTLPKNVKAEHSDDFFSSIHRALIKIFCEDNEDFCVSSYVHYDEKTPHIHFSFCPIKYDKDRKTYKFSAKDIVTRSNLQKLHPFLEKEVSKDFEKYGYTPQIITGEMSTRKNLPIEKYKEYATLKTAIEESKDELNKIERQHSDIEHKVHILSIEYEPKRTYIDYLDKLHSDYEIKENKNLLSGKVTSVTIPIDIWENQKILYADYSAAKAMRKATEKKIAEMQEYLSDIGNIDFEKDNKSLVEQVNELKAQNKQLEYSMKEINTVFTENPALKSEYDLTVQWLNNRNHHLYPEIRDRVMQ